MSKFFKRSIRKDSADHVHALPNGSPTMGMNMKPSQSSGAGYHVHLYSLDGQLYVSGAAFDEPGHTHSSEIGESSGPMPMPAKESFAGPGVAPKEINLYGGDNPAPDGKRVDSAQPTAFRIGTTWVVRNFMGMEIARGRSEYEVLQKAKKLAS